MGNLSEWFCEDVGEVLGGWNIVDSNVPVFDTLADKVVVDIDVFDVRIVFCVL